MLYPRHRGGRLVTTRVDLFIAELERVGVPTKLASRDDWADILAAADEITSGDSTPDVATVYVWTLTGKTLHRALWWDNRRTICGRVSKAGATAAEVDYWPKCRKCEPVGVTS